MPNYTTKLNLVKPLGTENYDISKVTNDNADIIDNAVNTIGQKAGNSTAIGYQALNVDDGTNNNNTAVGYQALLSNTTGSSNTASGNSSLLANTIGSSNIASGWASLYSNVSGSNGVAIGNESQRYVNNTTTAWTNYNTSVGYQALRGSTTPANNTGNYNTAVGYQPLLGNTTGSHNIALGYASSQNNTTGNNNVALGSYSLLYNTTGNSNVSIGWNSLRNSTTGLNNVAIGESSGRNIADGTTANTTSDYSVYLGSGTKALADDDQNEIVIGYNAIGAGSNTATIGNTSITKTVLRGNVEAGTITTSGSIKNDSLILSGNQINQYSTNGLAEVAINYTGYQGGTTQFRNTSIFDGKNGAIATFTGSDKSTTLYGPLISSGTFNQGSWNSPTFGALTQIIDASGTQHSVIVGRNSAGTRYYGLDFLDSTSPHLRLYAGSGYINLANDGSLTASGNVTAYSDERLKSNITTIENALDKVKALRGVEFDKNDRHEIGVIAQEVQKVIPEVVLESADEMKTLSVAYGNMVGLLIEAIKEQQKQIDELKARLDIYGS